ncbi:MAG: multicopper oxidase family protein [Byssovorax sp.]
MINDKGPHDKNGSGGTVSFDRRNFLRLGATIGTGLLLPQATSCGSDPITPVPPIPPEGAELFTPAWVQSKGGLLDIELAVTETQVTVDGKTFMTRAYTGLKVNTGTASFGSGAYSGTVPGPTIDIRPGDKLKVKLINNLPSDNSAIDATDCGIHSGSSSSSSSSSGGHSGPGMTNNTTNLHVHGLHVDPGPPGDDVLLEILPGASYDFVFDLPKDLVMPDGTMANHPAGTYWYHPHVHQSTAIQVFGGMAGAILIRDEANDDLDKLFSPAPQPGQGKEQILVLGEFMLQTCNGKTRLATYDEILTDADGTVDFFHINGQVNPVIRMRPSEVQRYRLIHAGFHLPLDVVFLRVPDAEVDPATSLPKTGYTPFTYACPTDKFGKDHPAQHQVFEDGKSALRAQSVPYSQVATDGVTYAKPLTMPLPTTVADVEYLIAPGNRADLLVQFGPGTYQMVTLGYDLGFACSVPQVLATVIVAGEPDTSVQIPATLKAPALYPSFDDPQKPGNKVVNARTLEFKVVVDPGATNTSGYHFTIDGKTFCESRVDQCVDLDAVEEWTVNNVKTGGTFHPFHIHVNSFLVTSINGMKPANAIWRDTMLLPKEGLGSNDFAGSFTFLSRFLHYEGSYVLHCHMLQHEDLGMMQLVQVAKGAACVPPSTDPCH